MPIDKQNSFFYHEHVIYSLYREVFPVSVFFYNVFVMEKMMQQQNPSSLDILWDFPETALTKY